MSEAEVFIVESLSFEDEAQQRFEGRIISEILALSGKECAYYYIRTKRELEEVLRRFSALRYRYLHLSCHGNEDSLYTTLDRIPFREFGQLIAPYISKRRLFLSACSATNRSFAENVMSGSGCYSILGPAQDILFSDAAVLWASFYHVMFRADSTAMRYGAVKAKAQEVADMYRVALTLIDHNGAPPGEYRLKKLKPRKEPS
jgi:hypothetical protein